MSDFRVCIGILHIVTAIGAGSARRRHRNKRLFNATQLKKSCDCTVFASSIAFPNRLIDFTTGRRFDKHFFGILMAI
jgi:hypothetical protein